VIWSVPVWAKSAPMRADESCVALTRDVARGLPFTRTVAPEPKFVPVTVIATLLEPAGALFGERDATVVAAFPAPVDVRAHPAMKSGKQSARVQTLARNARAPDTRPQFGAKLFIFL
jgi:hypothetical protein